MFISTVVRAAFQSSAGPFTWLIICQALEVNLSSFFVLYAMTCIFKLRSMSSQGQGLLVHVRERCVFGASSARSFPSRV